MDILNRSFNALERDFYQFSYQVYELLKHFTSIEEFEQWLMTHNKPINSTFYIKSGFPN